MYTYLRRASLINKANYAKAMKWDAEGLATVTRIFRCKYIPTSINVRIGQALEALVRGAERGYAISASEGARLSKLDEGNPTFVRMQVCDFWKPDEKGGCNKGVGCCSVHMVPTADARRGLFRKR